MSFYRSLLAAVAAIALASPVFADDTASTQNASSSEANMQLSDNSSSQSASSSDSQTQTKVNLNTASAKELMKVKGLNASKAKAIVAYRKKNGNFKATSDIANIKGFKKMSTDALQSIEDQLTVQ